MPQNSLLFGSTSKRIAPPPPRFVQHKNLVHLYTYRDGHEHCATWVNYVRNLLNSKRIGYRKRGPNWHADSLPPVTQRHGDLWVRLNDSNPNTYLDGGKHGWRAPFGSVFSTVSPQSWPSKFPRPNKCVHAPCCLRHTQPLPQNKASGHLPKA